MSKVKNCTFEKKIGVQSVWGMTGRLDGALAGGYGREPATGRPRRRLDGGPTVVVAGSEKYHSARGIV